MSRAGGPDPQAKRDRGSGLAFRSDLNGLRAIAVLAVLAFHFGLAPLRGGFVGVDIFFVISGYLMTGIILRRIERGRFSVAAFYLDRARRIVPALAALVALLLLFGAAVLLPEEWVILASQGWSSLLFVSNFLFWLDTPYFDPGLDQKWLLHSWSLSLEWQFYLLYPLILPALARYLPRRSLRPLMAGAAILSFAAMILLARVAPGAAFYLLPPRAWELLAGALVYLTPALSGRSARAAEALGLALIAGSIVLIDGAAWPGFTALAPVLGTVLVILAARDFSPVTANAAVRWIGLASYSIYLWHWPILVWLRRSGHDGDWRGIAAGLALSLLLGFLSWRFVERRLKPRTAAPRIDVRPIPGPSRALGPYAATTAALVVAAWAIIRSDGLPQRFSPEIQAVAKASRRTALAGASACYSTGHSLPGICRLGREGAPLLATLIGDSHADAQLAGLIEALPAGGGAVAFSALASCPPVLDTHPVEPRSRCGAFTRQRLAPLAAPRGTPLVLSASWAGYAARKDLRFGGEAGRAGSAGAFEAAFLRSACALAAAGPTYFVLPTPRFPFRVTRELQRRLLADPGAPDIAMPLADHLAANRAVVALLRRAASRCGVRLLDPSPWLCRRGVCDGSREHRPLYRDEHHLTAYGAHLLAPMFRHVFDGRAGHARQARGERPRPADTRPRCAERGAGHATFPRGAPLIACGQRLRGHPKGVDHA